MKIRSVVALIGLAISFAAPAFAQQKDTSAATSTATPPATTTTTTQNKKEIDFSGTHYWSGTPKVFPIDPDRIVLEMEIFGVRVNDTNDGPLNGASTYIAVLHYENKGHNKTGNPDPVRARDYEVWTDKDGDKVIWELTDDPAGAAGGTAQLIDGTGKYTGWQGTMEYTLQYPKAFPEGTGRGICREVVKIEAPQ